MGDINALDLPPATFDVIISIDTIYFSDDYSTTIAALAQALRPGGRLAFLYSHGREPWVPVEEFDVSTLPAANTPLAKALSANGFGYSFTDFTADDLRLAIRRQEVLADLRDEFEAEGNLFIYENRLGDANGIRAGVRRWTAATLSVYCDEVMDILIRLAVAPTTSQPSPNLAVTTYTAAFGHSFTPEDLAAHLARNLAPANVARFIAEDVVLVAEADGRLEGFVQFGTAGPEYAPGNDGRPGTAPPLCPRRIPESRRRYTADAGRPGTPTDAAMRSAIYLDVWEHNHGAQRFYARHGFEAIGSRRFEVESGADTSLDLIMVRRTKGAA